MKIVYKSINEIHPYSNNPRNNDKAVEAVANSIQEFGFKNPIVIDTNGEIINGHTRYKACLKLHINKVPCIIADDLDEEQIKAFRLADNKVGEIAEWNEEMLMEELASINLDMSEFGFDMESFEFEDMDEDEIYDDEEKENERNKTFNSYNMLLFDPSCCDGKYQMPIIEKENYIPNRLIGFNYAKTSEDKDTGIHFFIDDYQFERCWNNPSEYLEILRDYNCVLTPDFSLYMDMAYSVKVWNIYRSRLLGQYWQKNGLTVIPTISWAERETFDFCFDGIEQGSTVAISTIGVKRQSDAFQIWKDGMDEMIERIKPKKIICYGGKVEYDYKDIEVIYFKNEVTERMKGE